MLTSAASQSGFVYFISAYHMTPCGYFKIGITRGDSHNKRVKQIQSSSPFQISTVCVVTHSYPEALERSVLQAFKQYRIRGEWFAITTMFSNDFSREMTDRSHSFERAVSEYLKENCDGEVVV